MPRSENRTLWPVTGGAVGIQPGWFMGHSSAFFYINLGEGNQPGNYSLPMQPVFEITGPNNQLYNGSFCLPQVPLPVNFTAVVGQNATIQVIETAQHGAALYNVSQSNSLRPTALLMTYCSASTLPLPNQRMCPKSTRGIAPTPPTSVSNSFTAPTALRREPI